MQPEWFMSDEGHKSCPSTGIENYCIMIGLLGLIGISQEVAPICNVYHLGRRTINGAQRSVVIHTNTQVPLKWAVMVQVLFVLYNATFLPEELLLCYQPRDEYTL